jgi:hypothetical protein
MSKYGELKGSFLVDKTNQKQICDWSAANTATTPVVVCYFIVEHVYLLFTTHFKDSMVDYNTTEV